MASRDREVLEGVQVQGEDEAIVYTVNVVALGDDPTVTGVVVYDDRRQNVTNTVMPVNAPSALGPIITLSPLRSLTAGTMYRVEVAYTIDGNALESYFYVQAEQ